MVSSVTLKKTRSISRGKMVYLNWIHLKFEPFSPFHWESMLADWLCSRNRFCGFFSTFTLFFAILQNGVFSTSRIQFCATKRQKARHEMRKNGLPAANLPSALLPKAMPSVSVFSLRAHAMKTPVSSPSKGKEAHTAGNPTNHPSRGFLCNYLNYYIFFIGNWHYHW